MRYNCNTLPPSLCIVNNVMQISGNASTCHAFNLLYSQNYVQHKSSFYLKKVCCGFAYTFKYNNV